VGILLPPPVPDPHLARCDTPPAYTLKSTHPNTFHRKAPPFLFQIKHPGGIYIFKKGIANVRVCV